MKTFHSLSAEQTQALGNALALDVIKKHRQSRKGAAAIIALRGDLGAGKTTFVQGFLRGLGLKKRAQSPTFIIMRRHVLSLPARPFKNVFHIDAYRLKKASQMKTLGIRDIFGDPQNVILIEWPERIKGVIPKKTPWVSFLHGEKENERKIIIKK